MKKLLLTLTTIFLAGSAFADIQDPPMNDRGPTRKLGRAIGNMLFGITELPDTMVKVNLTEGNASAASYGIIKGTGRTLVRIGTGLFEFVTFPFPTHKGSYRYPLRAKIPWINGGYEEFPPEIAWQSRRSYVTQQTGY